jgi:alanine racemase
VGLVRPSWVEVDLAAIRSNVAKVAKEVAPSEVCVVVKADGYGHGDVPAAEAALAGGATRLAVATVAEGIRLREAEIEARVILLSEPPVEDVAEVVRWRLSPTVYTAEMLAALEAPAPAGFPVHVKADTGMHRVGVPPDRAFEIAAAVHEGPLSLEGLWTHFPVAEDDEGFTKSQLAAFDELIERLADAGIRPQAVHAANTAAALRFPDSRYDFVRLGIGAYGLRPEAGIEPPAGFTPAMRVISHVSHVQRLPAGSRPSYGRVRALSHESTVATVPIGYADGLRRGLTAHGEVLVGGRRHPFAGTITMDQALIDMGDHPVAVGDEVVLLGAQGEEEVSADEWAARLDTINWEVVCGFGPRMPRRYIG